LKKALPLYDAALERLDSGMNKIREAVHNLAPVTMLGVGALREKCEHSPMGKGLVNGVGFKAFGDTSNVPVHVWGVLEACLNEALTNVARHARPKSVNVSIDVTTNIARLCVENDGVSESGVSGASRPGTGLRNLRHRIAAVGGSLSVDSGTKKKFQIVCVIPIQ